MGFFAFYATLSSVLGILDLGIGATMSCAKLSFCPQNVAFRTTSHIEEKILYLRKRYHLGVLIDRLCYSSQ
jgi:hypothetical protein